MSHTFFITKISGVENRLGQELIVLMVGLLKLCLQNHQVTGEMWRFKAIIVAYRGTGHLED